MTDCHQKGREVGLWYEIESIESTLKSPKINERYRKFLKGLLKSYKAELRKGQKRSSPLVGSPKPGL